MEGSFRPAAEVRGMTMTDKNVLSGSTVFEPGLVKVTSLPRNHTTPLLYHTQEFWELICVDSGFALLGGEGSSVLLTPGDFAVIAPLERHSLVKAEDSRIYSCLFMESELGEKRDEFFSMPGIASLVKKNPSGRKPKEDARFECLRLDYSERYEFIRLAERMNTERISKDRGWQLLLRALLCEMLVFCSRLDISAKRTERSGDTPAGISHRVIKYIEENYSRSVSASDLAKEFGCSAENMTKQFRAELSLTPTEYLRRYRIAKSMELLCGTDMPVNDVALSSGFSDFSAFSRVFKQYEGDTPSAYRKKMRFSE